MPNVADDLRREASYFREHQHRMNYLEMREPEHMIPLRPAILSGRFSEIWRRVYNSPPS